MKTLLKNIITLLLVLLAGCAISTGSARTDTATNPTDGAENNGLIDGKLKPFVDKNIKDENINIGVPVYKF